MDLLYSLYYRLMPPLILQDQSLSGQSYKHFTILNYDSRVIIWGIFKSGMTLESYITIVEAL